MKDKILGAGCIFFEKYEIFPHVPKVFTPKNRNASLLNFSNLFFFFAQTFPFTDFTVLEAFGFALGKKYFKISNFGSLIDLESLLLRKCILLIFCFKTP